MPAVEWMAVLPLNSKCVWANRVSGDPASPLIVMPSSTGTEDLEAVAYLLRQGADLNVVSEVLTREMNAEQVALLNDLLENSSSFHVNGVEVVLASTASRQYVADFAVVVSSDFQTGGTWAGAVEALKAAGLRDKVKVTVMFRGREIVHTALGRQQLDRLLEAHRDRSRPLVQQLVGPVDRRVEQLLDPPRVVAQPVVGRVGDDRIDRAPLDVLRDQRVGGDGRGDSRPA